MASRENRFDIVAIAASAGGLKAISAVLENLPADFPIAIVVVQHLSTRSVLSGILAKRTSMTVKDASAGEKLRNSTVFVALPGKHLLVMSDKTLSLSEAEPVNYVRPSADLLLESVAKVYKEKAIAVILTGTGTDGCVGAQAIKQNGGIVISQDEMTSEFFGMPFAAISSGAVDFILALEEIPKVLMKLVFGEELVDERR